MSSTPPGNESQTNPSYAALQQENASLQEALREALQFEQFFRLVAEHVGDYVAVLDFQGRRVYNSRSYQSLLGETQGAIGTDSFAQVHPDDREGVRKAFEETLHSGTGHRLQYRFLLPDGRERHLESCGARILDDRGEPAYVVVVSRDMTERVEEESRIREIAFHDPLTQLANRRLLEDRLGQAIASSQRNGSYGAVLLLDLDHFKQLNDRYGHAVGDQLLIEVGRRVLACVRSTDTVARLGGHQFVVVVNGLDAERELSRQLVLALAEKLHKRLGDPYRLDVSAHAETAALEIVYRCSVSIGVALFLDSKVGIDQLLQRADAAMHDAKQSGENRICIAS
jgi:diguanylate cyclase (GGDEF)-like protein/PAS domain S-box-containing protein